MQLSAEQRIIFLLQQHSHFQSINLAIRLSEFSKYKRRQIDATSPLEEILKAPASEDTVGELGEDRVHGEQRDRGSRDDPEDDPRGAQNLPRRRPLDLRHLLRHPGPPPTAAPGDLRLLTRTHHLLKLRRHFI